MNEKLKEYIVGKLDKFHEDIKNPKIELMHFDNPAAKYSTSIFEARIYSDLMTTTPSLIIKFLIDLVPSDFSSVVSLVDFRCQKQTNVGKLFSLSNEDYLEVYSDWVRTKYWYGEIITKINYLLQQVIASVLSNSRNSSTTRLLMYYPDPFEVTTRTYDTTLWN